MIRAARPVLTVIALACQVLAAEVEIGSSQFSYLVPLCGP